MPDLPGDSTNGNDLPQELMDKINSEDSDKWLDAVIDLKKLLNCGNEKKESAAKYWLREFYSIYLSSDNKKYEVYKAAAVVLGKTIELQPDDPIPPTFWERLRKFLHQHRILTTASVILVVLISSYVLYKIFIDPKIPSTPPRIDLITAPENAEAYSDAVEIEARIRDNDGLESATLCIVNGENRIQSLEGTKDTTIHWDIGIFYPGEVEYYVQAEDILGSTARYPLRNVNRIQVNDNTPPQFIRVSNPNPSNPMVGDSVTLKASIVELSGVSNVQLEYWFSSEAVNRSSSEEDFEDDIWSNKWVIKMSQAGTLSYSFEATDEYGNTARSPENADDNFTLNVVMTPLQPDPLSRTMFHYVKPPELVSVPQPRHPSHPNGQFFDREDTRELYRAAITVSNPPEIQISAIERLTFRCDAMGGSGDSYYMDFWLKIQNGDWTKVDSFQGQSWTLPISEITSEFTSSIHQYGFIHPDVGRSTTVYYNFIVTQGDDSWPEAVSNDYGLITIDYKL